jgi:hypothetical protein
MEEAKRRSRVCLMFKVSILQRPPAGRPAPQEIPDAERSPVVVELLGEKKNRQ